MNTTNNTQNKMVTLATPYYGSMTRPHGRPEQIYIKLVANPTTGEFDQTGLCVWDPKKLPHLPDWLSRQGIETILCNDNPSEPDQSFSAAGVTLFRKQRGDIQEMVSNWKIHLTTGGDFLAA
jgi:hypothetical protein